MTSATLAPQVKDKTPKPAILPTAAQDEFLASLEQEKTQVSVFLVNGIRLVGRICASDPYTVLLENQGMQLVLKHAIATVCPATDRLARVPEQKPDRVERGVRLGSSRRPT